MCLANFKETQSVTSEFFTPLPHSRKSMEHEGLTCIIVEGRGHLKCWECVRSKERKHEVRQRFKAVQSMERETHVKTLGL